MPESRSNTPRRRSWWGALLLTLLLLVPLVRLAPLAWRTLDRGLLALNLPQLQLDNEEGALLFQALELRAGRSIYRPLTSPPWFVGTYPPLYLAANALLTDPSNPDLRSGRLIGFVSAGGIAALLGLIAALRTRNPAASLLAPLLFLATFEAYNWIAYYRVDLPAIFLSLSGLALVATAPERRGARAASIVLFLLALYTKQTTVAAPAAATVALLLRDRRLGLRYGAWLAGAGLAVFLLLSALTRGQFAIHTVLYNMNTWHLEDLGRWARHAGRLYCWLLAAFLLTALAAVRIAGMRRILEDPVWLYAAFALLTTPTIAKAGTAENYLLEPLAAVALVTCDGLGRLLRHWASGGGLIGLPAAAAAVLLTLHGFHLSSPRWTAALFSRRPASADLAAASEITRRLRAEPGETWSEPALYDLRAGRPLVFQPFIMSELARQGRWNPEPFTADLRQGRWSLIVTTRDITAPPDQVYAPAILDAMRAGYSESGRVRAPLWTFYLYRPR